MKFTIFDLRCTHPLISTQLFFYFTSVGVEPTNAENYSIFLIVNAITSSDFQPVLWCYLIINYI